jgi:hypothetical protein
MRPGFESRLGNTFCPIHLLHHHSTIRPSLYSLHTCYQRNIHPLHHHDMLLHEQRQHLHLTNSYFRPHRSLSLSRCITFSSLNSDRTMQSFSQTTTQTLQNADRVAHCTMQISLSSSNHEVLFTELLMDLSIRGLGVTHAGNSYST